MPRTARPLVARARLRRAPLAALLLAILLPGAAARPGPPVDAAPVAQRYRDLAFAAPGDASDPNAGPTGEKAPEQTLVRGGRWWGVLLSRGRAAYRSFTFDATAQAWADTGVLVASRADSHAAALWDETARQRYVATAVPPGSPDADLAIRALRYSFTAATQAYGLDANFPVVVARAGIEAVALDQDSSGTFWLTYTLDTTSSSRSVYVDHASAAGAARWGVPYVLPGCVGTTDMPPDDIAALVAYNGRSGVMWSNQRDAVMYFAAHRYGAGDGAWQQAAAWQGPDYADDHIKLKSLQSDPSGQVFAAIKTSLDDPATLGRATRRSSCCA